MSNLRLKIENKIAIVEFDQPDSKVNVLDTGSMEEFNAILDQLSLKTSGDVKALIIASKKDGIFIAGADIKEIENITESKEAFQKAEDGKKVLDKLAGLDMITMAVINGACLGGGLELALACKYRVAGFSSKIKMGLPEVKLGIIPGFAGTQRLPRVMGLLKALGMILAGKIISSKEALRDGLVDRLFPDVDLLGSSIAFVNELIQGTYKTPRKKKKKFLQVFLEDTIPGRAVTFSQARKNVLKLTKGFYPAPLKAIDVIKSTYGRDIVKGSRLESEVFSELAVTDVSKNLIKVFYLLEEFKKYPWTDKAIKPIAVEKCGVLGAGVMGGGIAQLVSYKDIPVRIKDINYEALMTAFKTAGGLYKYALKKRRLKPHQVQFKFGLMSPTVTYSGFDSTDMVIEAVVENLDIKKQVFKELARASGEKTIFASNTSALPISEMSEVSGAPDRVVGLHFFNPVHKMPLVEVIRADKTSEETVATTVAFARKLGKIVIVVKDVPGFLINRILLSYLNEAGFLVQEGLSIERVDSIARKFGLPMGPVTLIDEVGIDVGYKVAKILEEAYGERMKVASILKKVESKGLLGKKGGEGFYIHKKKKKVPNPLLCELVKTSHSNKVIDDDTALKRMVYIMVNEAARCLEEGVVDRPDTVDIGMITGTGFPPFRGGLLRYADAVGIDNIVKDLMSFKERFRSDRFDPCGLLVQKADKKESFYTND